MRKLIFDLDGTLWETSDSYLYSYNKMVEKYHIEPRKTDEEVLAFLGIKLDILSYGVFSGYGDLEVLGREACMYSVEYVKEHPHFLIDNIYSFFAKLKKKYEIYIVSNCPRVYMDTFFAASGIEAMVQGSYTIEDGEKKENLKRIVGDSRNAIFIGDAESDYEEIVDHTQIHFCYATYGYKQSSKYDYKMERLEELPKLLEKIDQIERKIDGLPYQVYVKDGTSITLMYGENYTLFGFIELGSYEDFRMLLQECKNTVKKPLLGPMDGKTWYSYRISIDHFDWRLYPDCKNDEELLSIFYKEGFVLHQSYSSTLATINTKAWEYAKKHKLSKEYSYKVVSGIECLSYLDDLYQVALESFQEADYYRQISLLDFKEIYMNGLGSLSYDLFLIYHEGNLIGFNFCYKDPLERFYVAKTIGILKEYRKENVFLSLLDLSYQKMKEYGFEQVLYHFQNERTGVLKGISKGHEIKTKHYGLLRYDYE